MTYAILAWMPGPWEIVLILLVALLLFGGKKLPELMRGVGKGLRIFKKEVQGVKDDLDDAINSEPEEDEDPPKTAKKTADGDDSDEKA